jgi:dTDP-4-dehydrorhamnose reductase
MLNYKNILFTGSNGRFGKVFKKTHAGKKYNYPTSKELDITDIKSVERYFKKNKTDLIIHCAALSRPMNIHNKNISKSIAINIMGTCNLVKICEKYKIKLIYFSTSYVYPGSKGNYSEKSNLKPINNYAWSKLGGECAVQMYKKSLILRICMTEKPFIHKEAFTNMKTNFIFHDEVARLLPLFYKHTGIINIGGETQSVYDFAKKFNKNIKGIKLKITNKNDLNSNVSMNINKMKKIINA